MSPRPFVLLRFPGDEAFAQAVCALAGRYGESIARQLTIETRGDVMTGELLKRLDAHRGLCLVGLMDDFSHIFLEEAVRDLNGSILCRGRHRAMTDSCAASRHGFTTTRRACGIGSALAAALASHGAPFIVREDCLDEPTGAPDLPPPAVRSGWMQALGASYARVAIGAWERAPLSAHLSDHFSIPDPKSQAWVSLVAQL